MSGRVTVGAHPWVFASRRDDTDIFPIIDEVIGDIAYAGFDGIELMHTALLHEGAVDAIAGLCQRESICVIGSSFGGAMWDSAQRDETMAQAACVIGRLEELGAETLGVSTGATPERKTPEQLDVQAEALREISGLCEGSGITMNLHNHTYEVADDQYELRETLTRLPEAKLGPDLDWLTRAGVDPMEFIRCHASRIVFLHLRDNREGRWVESVGEGEMDFGAMGALLKETGFCGQAVVELAWEADFEPTRPLRETLKMSRQHTERTMGW